MLVAAEHLVQTRAIFDQSLDDHINTHGLARESVPYFQTGAAWNSFPQEVLARCQNCFYEACTVVHAFTWCVIDVFVQYVCNS